MLVKNWMSKDVITIDVNDSMENAVKIMRENKIRTLPVLKGEWIVGIVTDRDIKKASASGATTLEIHELLYVVSKIKIDQIMTKNVITVSQYHTIDEVAEILVKQKISGAPVVSDNNLLIGIITQSDLFRVITTLSGPCDEGFQFAFQVKDIPGSIKTVTDIIRNHGGRISSIMTSYLDTPEGYRDIFIKSFQIDRGKLEEMKKMFIQVSTLLYMIDYGKNVRDIF